MAQRILQPATSAQSSQALNCVRLAQGISASGPSIARMISPKLIASGGRCRV